MKNSILVIFALAVVSPSVFATEPAKTGAPRDPQNVWQDCGIGAMIFPNTPVGAVISNIIWDLGTTATSSMTTSKGSCSGRGATMAMFINKNYKNLAEETAGGQGKHLDAMLDIMHCSKSAYAAIISDVRADFSAELADPSYSKKSALQKSESYFNNVMQKAQKNDAGCSVNT